MKSLLLFKLYFSFWYQPPFLPSRTRFFCIYSCLLHMVKSYILLPSAYLVSILTNGTTSMIYDLLIAKTNGRFSIMILFKFFLVLVLLTFSEILEHRFCYDSPLSGSTSVFLITILLLLLVFEMMMFPDA